MLVRRLDQVAAVDLAVAGGKGANLGELIRAGLPVPPGFVLTTAAYDCFVADNQLGETIARASAADDGGAAIRTAFEAAPLPADVARAVLAAYADLGNGPVAVRSSATTEDLPGAAFAGQQETFLNVLGAEALLDAVRQCWASLWADRAIAYRQHQGFDQQTPKLAVVVQRMVAADAAGVLFTANPVSGARDETVIAANPGLGEAVVAGLATPDHYVLRRGGWAWRIAERRLGRREVIVRASPGGGTEQVSGSSTHQPEPAVSDQTVRELARLGATIQRHFGVPQDVEWAWANGQPFILQARPITALPDATPRPSLALRMLASLAAEMLPARPYPLEMTTWGPRLVVTGLLGPLLRLFGLVVRFDRLFVEEDGVVVRLSGQVPVRPTPGLLLAPFRLLRQARRYDPARWAADPLLAEAQVRVRVLERRDVHALPWPALLSQVHEALAVPGLIGQLRVRYLPRPLLAAGVLALLLRLLGRSDLLGTLFLTGGETQTFAMNRALEALAASIRANPSLAETFAHHEPTDLWAALEAQPSGRAFLDELRAFLDQYGHREAGATMQLSQSTWRDRPAVVLGILKTLALAEARPPAARQGWEVARDDLLAHPLLRLPSLRPAFLAVLEQARWFPRVREDTRFYGTLILPVLWRTLHELGRRLVEVGALDVAEDVYHLQLEDLQAVGAWPPSARQVEHLRSLVARRKQRRATLEGTPLVDPRFFHGAEPDANVLVRGAPGGPGVAEGPVRVIRDGAEFGRLQPGEVLVAPYTNPAWTPLFQRAAAVVVDSGGPASHAAIVAREYGIPAVMGTGDGTRRLADGQYVRVDGSRGVVVYAPRPSGSEARGVRVARQRAGLERAAADRPGIRL